MLDDQNSQDLVQVCFISCSWHAQVYKYLCNAYVLTYLCDCFQTYVIAFKHMFSYLYRFLWLCYYVYSDVIAFKHMWLLSNTCSGYLYRFLWICYVYSDVIAFKHMWLISNTCSGYLCRFLWICYYIYSDNYDDFISYLEDHSLSAYHIIITVMTMTVLLITYRTSLSAFHIIITVMTMMILLIT